MDIIGLYDGLLLQASYRGLGFTMLDSRDEAGRRALRFMFPGQDASSFQDLGALDGTIRITGLIIGDDYIHQSERMRQAFRTAGPGTLVHPWMGAIDVVLTSQPPTITYSQTELRVARFEATFWPFAPRAPQQADTLTGLLDALEDVRTQAATMLGQALAPVAQALAVIGFVERFCGQVGSVFLSLTGGSPADAIIAGDVQPAALALQSAGTVTPGAAYAAGIAALLAAPSAAIVAASNPVQLAAIGPGDAAVTPVASDPRVTAAILLAAVPLIAPLAGAAAPGPALAVAAQALATADAITAASDIVFTSDQDARSWMGTLLGALDGATAAAAVLGATQPATAGLLWGSLVAARSALVADLNAAIGRLPTVTTLAIPRVMSAWLIAQYLAGDDPSSVLATYQDIVARNGLRNPALLPLGPLEVLQP